MTDDRLTALLHRAVPPLGPLPPAEAVLSQAVRRHSARRRLLLGGAVASVLAVTLPVTMVVGRARPERLPVAATPCGSPFSSRGSEQSVAYPTGGRTLRITVRVSDHFTARWGFCGEHGTVTSDDEPGSSTSVLDATDIGVYSSPRPGSPDRGFGGRPFGDGVFDVRYLAQRAGRVTLHGKGSLGSNGFLEVTVLP